MRHDMHKPTARAGWFFRLMAHVPCLVSDDRGVPMAKWYFESNGLQYGPVTVGELRLLAAAGRLRPTDRVRKHNMAKWARAKAVRGLFLPVAAEVAHDPPARSLGDGDPVT